MKKLLIVLPALMMSLFFLITCNKQEINKKDDSVPTSSIVSSKQVENLIVADSIQSFNQNNFNFYYVYSGSDCYWGWNKGDLQIPIDTVAIKTLKFNDKIMKGIKLDRTELQDFTAGVFIYQMTGESPSVAVNRILNRFPKNY